MYQHIALSPRKQYNDSTNQRLAEPRTESIQAYDAIYGNDWQGDASGNKGRYNDDACAHQNEANRKCRKEWDPVFFTAEYNQHGDQKGKMMTNSCK